MTSSEKTKIFKTIDTLSSWNSNKNKVLVINGGIFPKEKEEENDIWVKMSFFLLIESEL